MKNSAPLLALLLLGCAHTGGQANKLPFALSRYEGSAEQLIDLESDDGQLRIRAKKNMPAEEARKEVRYKLAQLKLYAERQADGYSGPISPSHHCRSQEFPKAESGMLARAELSVSPAFAIDCYAQGPDFLREERQYFYCPSLRTLFEISLFQAQSKPAPGRLAFCD